ncbi:HD domain-containing phosphohydrolase [uncultured Pelagimonas sp.]|uniref:HD domain-containing phosphohydrolase n=1 Tax=uncultured Pelagimonas sp. TaxID=1618102 RepID=UPI00260EDD0C|nr:HD domain-containing phosphohydrolase [uncultured Pelagimonas sp.]
MRLSEAIGTLAIAGDCATGRPRGACLTGSVIATGLARSYGLDEKTCKATYYTSLFRFLGCTSSGPEAGSMALGDDRRFSLAFLLCDWLDLSALEAALKAGVALDAAPDARDAAFGTILEHHDAIKGIVEIHCEQSRTFAARLPVPANVLQCMPYLYARWDGGLGKVGTEDIPAPVRAVSIGHVAALYCRLRGVQAAKDEIANRAGRDLDPQMCAHLLANWDVIFAPLEDGSEFDVFVAAEPGSPIFFGIEHCEALSLIGADLVDQKSEWMGGHSRRVSALSGRAGQIVGIAEQPLMELRHSALLHDIGKCAIDNRLLNKAADLSHAERLEFESHSFQTEYILSHGDPFRTFGMLPSSAEERFDGSGYHRHMEQKGMRENVLAAANLYDELVFDRPGHPAMSAKEATDHLTEQSKSGALMPNAVAAVLQAAGSPAKTARKALPFGLSRREAQVIACLARSETTPQIAARLGISAKTTDHHVQSIYTKTGVRGRAAIAILAIEHGLGSDEKELAWDVIKRKWLNR